MPELDRELRRVAIHESAHAILAHSQGLQVSSISIVPNDESLGRFVPGWDGAELRKRLEGGRDPDRLELLVGKALIVYVGGLRAERILLGKGKPELAADDYGDANTIAGKQSGGYREHALRIRLAEAQADNVIRSRRREIRGLAAVLVIRKKLEGRALRGVIRQVSSRGAG